MPALLKEPAVFEEFTQMVSFSLLTLYYDLQFGHRVLLQMQTASSDGRSADVRKAKLNGPEILRKFVLGRHQDFEPPIEGNGDYKQRGPKHPQFAKMLVPIEHYDEFQEDEKGYVGIRYSQAR